MAEKLRDKLERLSRDLADSVCGEVELLHNYRAVAAEKEKFERQFLEYAKDQGLAHTLEEARDFLQNYEDTSRADSEDQLKLEL